MEQISQRLKPVVIVNRSWEFLLSSTVLADNPTSPPSKRLIVLDPPYLIHQRSGALYQSDYDGSSNQTAINSYNWAVANGNQYPIVYFCHVGDFDVPEGWQMETKSFRSVVRAGKTVDAMFISPALQNARRKGVLVS